MLDLEQLEADYEEFRHDKAELFDFYHNNWDKLIAEIHCLRQRVSGEPPLVLCDTQK